MTTAHQDLRTGRTIWQGTAPDVSFEAAKGTIEADMLIVGAGVIGALIADCLAESGLKVVLAERRKPLCGSTMATTALIQFELDKPLLHLGKIIGDANAQRVWLRSKRAVEHLERRVHGIACDWCPRSTLYLAGNVLGSKALNDEANARDDIGLSAFFLDAGALMEKYGVEAEAAVRSSGNAECNPVQMAGGLLQRAITRGARIFAPVEIEGAHEGVDGIVADSKQGVRFKANALVYATGYEVPEDVPTKNGQVISTWAMATQPQPDKLWPTRALIWEASDPYLYVRTTRDGRVIAGGEDEEFSNAEKRDAMIAEKTATIADKLKALFPQLDVAADYAWTGSFGSSDTGMPAIGLIPGKTKSYAVLGFGGNGITFGMIAAEILHGALTGKPDPDTDLFAFA
jgi:glycine/D-amino acid oxidase-like deaminating enzyme